MRQVPTASDDFPQTVRTADSRDRPITAISQPFTTQDDSITWEEDGNDSDSTSHNLICADNSQRHQSLKYGTEHGVTCSYDRSATHADGAHTSSSLGQFHSALLSWGTPAPYSRQLREYPSRTHI